jgi:hypothetical protein
MASIRIRQKAKGGESYTVDDKSKAQELKDFLDSNGNSFKLAAKAKIRKDSTAPTVADHINLLRKPQPSTVSKCRQQLANHIAPSDLGKTPVDRVDREAVILWMDGLVAQSRANQPTGQPLSRKTKANSHALLSDAFKVAKRLDGNPARGLAAAEALG